MSALNPNTNRLKLTALLLAIAAVIWLLAGFGRTLLVLVYFGVAAIWIGPFRPHGDPQRGNWSYLIAFIVVSLIVAGACYIYAMSQGMAL